MSLYTRYSSTGVSVLGEIMDEHFTKKGMYIIKPDEKLGSMSSTSDEIMWKIVTQLVEDYSKVHPKETSEIINDNKILNKVSNNTHASGKDGVRYAMRCSPGLVRVIEKRFPNFFIDKKNLHKFMETFRAFRIAEVI